MQDNQFLKWLKQNHTLLVIGLVLLSIIINSVNYTLQLHPNKNDIHIKGHKGVFDYSNIDFSVQKYSTLEGDVEFYWNQLLTPEDFKNPEKLPKPVYQHIPLEWNGLEVDGKKVGPMGYGTYRFFIDVNKPDIYGFKIKEFETAFAMWINGKFFGGAGEVGKSKKEMKPSWQRKDFIFFAENNRIEVILQISNFHHRNGGATEPILFAQGSSLSKIKNIRIGIEFLMIGIITLLILYHLTLYHYRRSDKSSAYFSMMAIFVLFRMSTTGEKLMINFATSMPWELAVRIEYISIPLFGIYLMAFLKNMIPDNIPNWFQKSVQGMAAILCLIILLFPARIFTYASYAILVVAVYMIVGIFILILRALIQKIPNSGLLFAGSFLLLFTMLNDILFYLEIIQSTYLLPFGLISLLFVQAFIISKNSSLAHIQVEKLSNKLEKHNDELEEIVEKRTQELQKINSEVTLQNNMIQNQADVLNQANKKLIDLDRFKKEITKMMVHDLKNPLSNIIGFMQLPEINENTRELIYHSGKEMQNLIQNILDVNKYEETRLEINLKEAPLDELVKEAYKQNEFQINLNNIKFENKVPKNLIIKVDEKLIIRVLTNIISNATKYKNENGLIQVTADLIKDKGRNVCRIKIYNTGEYIPKDKLESIFNIYSQIYTGHSEHSYSSGIGLTFCKMAIEAHGGKIGVNSKKDEGVTFWLTLPYKS